MSTTIEDMKGGMSNCCGALMYEEYGICCKCGEHCESVEEDAEEIDQQINRALEERNGL